MKPTELQQEALRKVRDLFAPYLGFIRIYAGQLNFEINADEDPDPEMVAGLHKLMDEFGRFFPWDYVSVGKDTALFVKDDEEVAVIDYRTFH